MSPVLPFDVLVLIIDFVGENKDTNLLRELALVSHSFLQICSKHLFATVELHDAIPNYLASSKRGFIKLLKSRPDVINYIRKLRYMVTCNSDDDHLLLPLLSKFLPTTSRLNCLKITTSCQDWNTLDTSLTSALLHLMRLPTINHIDLSFIQNFPLSSLTPSVNLHRFDIYNLRRIGGEDSSSEIAVQLETMPKIREFRTSESSLLTTKLLHAKTQDGRPAFNFTDLRRLSMSFIRREDERNIRYLLQNAKLLEKFHLSVGPDRSLVGLLSPNAATLKVLDLVIFLYNHSVPSLAGLYVELEAMAPHNMLEALSFDIHASPHDKADFIGSIIQRVGDALVKPGWSALRRVSFKVSLVRREKNGSYNAKLFEALQSLPDTYNLSHLSKLESIAFNYSVRILWTAADPADLSLTCPWENEYGHASMSLASDST